MVDGRFDDLNAYSRFTNAPFVTQLFPVGCREPLCLTLNRGEELRGNITPERLEHNETFLKVLMEYFDLNSSLRRIRFELDAIPELV
jgi:hypothetical protein